VGELRYTPWGEERSGFAGFNTDRTYTGQRRESFGLLDYIARYYDPQLGRFISADTIVPEPGNPQSLNHYAYAQNSPLSFIDPDGHVPYPITIRSFAPFESFGFGFHGDNRGYSVDESSTARVRQTIDFDTDKTSLAVSARSDPSWHTLIPSDVRTEHPRSSVLSPLAVGRDGNSRTFAFQTWYGGSNPFAPDFLKETLNIDVLASFNVVENKTAGFLNISAALTGDNFPATEAYITDPSGQSVFIGIGFHQGAYEGVDNNRAPFKYLPGVNNLQISKLDLRINLDNKGNFTNVMYRNKGFTITQWNRRFIRANPGQPNSLYTKK
jgi:RHS repeat-associated protein